MGSDGIAFSEGSPCLQQNKLHSDKNATKQLNLPQGTQLSTPGDRLHKHRQAVTNTKDV